MNEAAPIEPAPTSGNRRVFWLLALLAVSIAAYGPAFLIRRRFETPPEPEPIPEPVATFKGDPDRLAVLKTAPLPSAAAEAATAD